MIKKKAYLKSIIKALMLYIALFGASFWVNSAFATDNADSPVTNQPTSISQQLLDDICTQVSDRLASVSYEECRGIAYDSPDYFSSQGRPVITARFTANETVEKPARVLFIGGIHGDEYASVSVTFKWLNTLNIHHSGSFDWLFVPLANPDGLLAPKATRVNGRGVDLNRNFHWPAGDKSALAYWRDENKKRARYYPGERPVSEPESKMIFELIDAYKPTVIVSMHAPHGIVDFDGDSTPPDNLGALPLRRLGTYPGSLGNYCWNILGIPVVTVELASAGSMPSPEQVSGMWVDLVRWVRTEVATKVSQYDQRRVEVMQAHEEKVASLADTPAKEKVATSANSGEAERATVEAKDAALNPSENPLDPASTQDELTD